MPRTKESGSIDRIRSRFQFWPAEKRGGYLTVRYEDLEALLAERDALREALQVVAYGGSEETVTEDQLREVARAALEGPDA